MLLSPAPQYGINRCDYGDSASIGPITVAGSKAQLSALRRNGAVTTRSSSQPLLILLGQPEAGRSEPLAHPGTDLCLAGPSQHLVPQRARREQFGFLAKALCFGDKAHFHGFCLSEIAPLEHGPPPCSTKAGARRCVVITDNCQNGRAVMMDNVFATSWFGRVPFVTRDEGR